MQPGRLAMSKTSRAKTRLMRATKQVSIKVKMLNFHFNTTLDYIINLSYRTADFMQAVILNLFAQTNQNVCHAELVSAS